MLFSKKYFLALYVFLQVFTSSVRVSAQGFSPIYSCPGPYACILSTYLGLQFPDGTHQTTAASGGGGGGVTSIGWSDGSSTPLFSVSGSPVTTSGVITATLATRAANLVFASATSGGVAQPTFRSLVAADLPTGALSDVGTDGITVGNGTTAVIGSGTTISQHVSDTTHAGYLSSSDWNTFNGKQASGNYITALTSDVSASGPGSVSATVNSVGGSSASNVNAATVLANAATSANTASAICRRDSSGNFSAGTITAALTGTASGNPPNARTISTTSPITGGGDLSADRTFAIPAATNSVNGYLTSADWTTFNNKQSTLTLGNLTDVGTDGITIGNGTGAVVGSGTTVSQHVSDATHNGYLSSTDWSTFNGKQASGSYITALTGDVTATGPNSSAATVASVGGSSASNVNAATVLANNATDANTASTIVKRDGSGNFSFGTGTGAITGTASGNTTYTANQYGVILSGSGNAMSVLAPDASASKLLKSGGASANPSWLAYTDANTASTVVARDGSGNFSAGTITAALTGTASGNLVSGGALGTPSSGTMTNVSGTAASLTAGAATLAISTSALKSATTTVNVDAATAPTVNQVLTATDSTHATWQTPGAASGTVTSVAQTVPAFLSIAGSPVTTSGTLAISYSGTALPIANGGSAVTAAPTTASASNFAAWDASVNLPANNHYNAYTTTAQAGGTTTLTVSSTKQQFFTGSSGQTIVLPVVSTLPSLGFSFEIVNLGTGTLTVQSSGGNTIGQTLRTLGSRQTYTAILLTGTTAASWNGSNYIVAVNGGVSGSSVPTYTDASGYQLSSTGNFLNNSPTSGTPLSSSVAIYNGQSLLNTLNVVRVYTTTATAAGTTTMTINSGHVQVFTGVTTQIVKLPSTGASGTSTGLSYEIWNQSTGALTIQTSTAAALQTMAANTWAYFEVNSTADNTAARWNTLYIPLSTTISGTGNQVLATSPTLTTPVIASITNTGGVTIDGSNTNDAAAAGKVGETFTSTVVAGSAVSLTTATAATVTSISPTAGDWDFTGVICIVPGATTSFTNFITSVSKTTNTLSSYATTSGVPVAGELYLQQSYVNNVPAADFCTSIPTFRASLSGTTTYYLVAQSTFSISTAAAYGFIQARRAR